MRAFKQLLACVAIALPLSPARGNAAPNDAPVASGEAVLEIGGERIVKLVVDGKDVTGQTEVRCDVAKRPGRKVDVEAHFADGSKAVQAVRLQAGWRVPVRFTIPRAVPNVIVPQIGCDGPAGVAVAFSHDGTKILVGGRFGADNSAILYDATTGDEIRRFRGGGGFVAFSRDGTRILTRSDYYDTGAVWDSHTGETIQQFRGETLAFSDDGRRVLARPGSDDDHTVVLWDATTGKKLRTFAGHTDDVMSAAFGPDGKQILTGSLDKTAILWDSETGVKTRTFSGQMDKIVAVAFAPDGKSVVTATGIAPGPDSKSDAVLWDTRTGAKIRTFDVDGEHFTSVAFSPNGQRILMGMEGGKAIIWSVTTGEQVRRFEGLGPVVNAVAFAPDGRQVLFAVAEDIAVLFDAETGERIRTFAGRAAVLRAVEFSPDGQYVMTGSERAVSLWPARTGAKFRSIMIDKNSLSCAAFRADGRQLVLGSFNHWTWDDSRAYLYDVASGNQVRMLNGRSQPLSSVAFSPDSQTIAAGSWDHTAILWDAKSGERLHTLDKHAGRVSTVLFAPDGKRLITTSGYGGTDDGDNSAILWDVASGAVVHKIGAHSPGLECAALVRDGSQLLTGSLDGAAILWDVKSSREIRRFTISGHGSLGAVAISPCEPVALWGCSGGTAAIWELESGKTVGSLAGHTSAIAAVAYNPDGSQALTGSLDGTTRLWSMATGQELAQLIELDAGKEWLVFTPDGLFDGSEGGRKAVRFRVGDELKVVRPEQGYSHLYHPGLLQEILAGHAVVVPKKAAPEK